MTYSREAFWWSLFSAGGVLAALFLPAIILVEGVLDPPHKLMMNTAKSTVPTPALP